METFQHFRSLHGCVIFMLIATISEGLTCETPSSLQCYRQDEDQTVYICEWDFNRTETSVTYSLYFNDSNVHIIKFEAIKEKRREINEEELIVSSKVNFWVEARTGNYTYTSPIKSGILSQIVKYEAPQNVSLSWLRNNLSLSWKSKFPSLAEVWFKKHGNPTESWQKRLMNTTKEGSTKNITIPNLAKSTAYEVKIRQRSIQAEAPLWSECSPVFIVPAELERPPLVKATTTLFNGTRLVKMTWAPMPDAAALRGVTYNVNITQPSKKCPGSPKKSQETIANIYTVYVSYSAANITVVARNAAGLSPPATVYVPAASAADLKTCNSTLVHERLSKSTRLEFYELRDADLIPEKVYHGKKNFPDMKNFTRYLYFEHRCRNSKPHTVKMCLYYKKQGAPSKAPPAFTIVSHTHNSADLTWKEIPYELLNGFLTHYKLCTLKINSQSEAQECTTILASATKHHLKDLTPATNYNISLAGVTQAGEGPSALLSFITLPEKPFNVWISFGLLVGFFLFSTVCSVVMKRAKTRLLPPVPKPVIPDTTPQQREKEEMWEREEEVHELTLHKILPEQKAFSGEPTVLTGEWDDGTEREVEKDGCCSGESDDESSSVASEDKTLRKTQLKDLEQVDTELARLIYKNGLVFDVKSE